MEQKDKKFSEWHGIDRSDVKWQPTIDESKCIGCGICATTCGRMVYKYDYGNGKSKVVKPNNCMVACQTCANLCPAGAISFTKQGETTRQKAQNIVKRFDIVRLSKKELEKKKAELDTGITE